MYVCVCVCNYCVHIRYLKAHPCFPSDLPDHPIPPIPTAFQHPTVPGCICSTHKHTHALSFFIEGRAGNYVLTTMTGATAPTHPLPSQRVCVCVCARQRRWDLAPNLATRRFRTPNSAPHLTPHSLIRTMLELCFVVFVCRTSVFPT